MDFQERLTKAIERGQHRGDERARAKAEKEVTEKELARLHSQYRLELSEHIETQTKQFHEMFKHTWRSSPSAPFAPTSGNALRAAKARTPRG